MRNRSLLTAFHWRAIAVFCLLLLAIGIVGNMDHQAEIEDRALYCEMVSIWNADQARGIPAADRAGWPPFDGQCHE